MKLLARAMLGLMTLSFLAWAAASYAGSKACMACHRKIYASYIRTPMGQSLRRATQAAQLALAPAPVAIGRFKVFRKGDSLYQSETEVGTFGDVLGETTHRLEYVVGSGANGYGYFVSDGGRLIEAPLSYYTRTGKWDLSPGYDAGDRGFARPVVAACVACHSGRSQPVPNRLGLYLDPPFLEMAIGCENCHGPGRKHSNEPTKAAIVNPARLSARESERICAQCHQDPEAAPDADLLSHASSMQQSKCYRASGGKLTCTTCHDPHVTVTPAAAAAAFYGNKCMKCHVSGTCRHAGQGACAQCHLPKRQVRGIPHAALTDHRIPRGLLP